MDNVSWIFFNKCIYFSYYMVGCLPSGYTHTHTHTLYFIFDTVTDAPLPLLCPSPPVRFITERKDTTEEQSDCLRNCGINSPKAVKCSYHSVNS